MWQSPPFKSGQPNADMCHILANLSAPIKHCHVIISSISHETLTLISATKTTLNGSRHSRQPPQLHAAAFAPVANSTIFLAHRSRHHDASTALATHSPATIARCRRRTSHGNSSNLNHLCMETALQVCSTTASFSATNSNLRSITDLFTPRSSLHVRPHHLRVHLLHCRNKPSFAHHRS